MVTLDFVLSDHFGLWAGMGEMNLVSGRVDDAVGGVRGVELAGVKRLQLKRIQNHESEAALFGEDRAAMQRRLEQHLRLPLVAILHELHILHRHRISVMCPNPIHPCT